MVSKMFANVIFCLIIVNVLSLRIHQLRPRIMGSMIQKEEDDVVQICFPDGKCSKTKYTARFMLPKEEVIQEGVVQEMEMQTEQHPQMKKQGQITN